MNEKIEPKLFQNISVEPIKICEPSPIDITTMLNKSFFYQIEADTSNVTVVIIVNDLCKILGITEFKQNIVSYIDNLMATILQISPTKTFNIYIDLDGFQLKLVNKNARNIIKILIKLFQDKYPNTLNRCLIVNATKLFKVVYKLLYYCLDDITRKKLVLVSKNKQIINSNELL